MVRRLWESDRPLTVVGLLMMAMTPVSIVLVVIDSRIITGMPAWLKPAKFAFSTGLFCLTMAWILQHLPQRRRLQGVVGWVTAMVFLGEVAIIDLQAWRGTTSHFNVGTPLDATLFSVMGAGIALQTLMTVLVAVALWRQHFDDLALGWALRLGLTVSILGASIGGLMTSPTAAQRADLRAGHRIALAGAHTVGAPDGDPGLLGTGWSLEDGDLRVPHFIGLHAVQVLPLVAIVLQRRRVADARRLRLILATAASYATLFAILLWQALRAESVVAPDGSTLTVVAIWGTLTVALFGWLGGSSDRVERVAV